MTNFWERTLRISGWNSEYSCVNNFLKYLRYRKTGSEGSRCHYCANLCSFCKHVGKSPDDLVALKKSDIERLIEEYCYYKREKGWRSSRTANQAIYVLKTFFKVNGFRGVDELEIDKPEEVAKLAGATDNLRDRAFVLTHYDGGFRIGETLSMKVQNVEFDKYTAVVRLDGKTGPRRVRLTISTPALAAWLSIHPFRSDPDASVWIGIDTVGKNKPLTYAGARSMLKRLAKKTGLKKRIYTHLMRHSKATELATILTEAQMKEHPWTARF